jgi:hypothetical protein
MPVVIPFFTAAAAAIGMTAAQFAIGLLTTAASIGLSYYQQEKAKQAAKRSSASKDIQQNIKQGTFPRYTVLGKAKVGGVLAFYEATDDPLYIATILSNDIIDGVDKYYLNEKEVLVDSLGNVTTPPWFYGNHSFIKLELHYGYTDQPASTFLTSAFPGIVTSAHKLAGIAYLVVSCETPKSSWFQAIYNSQVPAISALVRGVLVYDPRDATQNNLKAETWKTSTNPALLLLYYFTATNGYGMSFSLFDQTSFSRIADFCDELIETRTGGQRKRYEMGGVFSYDSDPVDIINDILKTFAAEIYVNEEGLFALSCEELEVPDVTITEDMVQEISISGFPGALYEYSTIKTRFTSEDHGYNENGEEADPWVDETIRAQIGREVPFSFDLPYVFRHDQARRLMKRQLFRLNPEWSIDVELDYNGLELFGERICRFVFPKLGIDGNFRIETVAPDDQAGLAKIVAKLTSIDPDAYEWDALTEEGEAPAIPPATSDDGSPQTPSGLSVLVGSDTGVIQALLTWASSTNGHTQLADKRDVTGSGAYVSQAVTNDDRSYLWTGLTSGNDYEFRVWLQNNSYGESAKASLSFNATAAVGSTSNLGAAAATAGVLTVNVTADQSAAGTAAWVEFCVVAHGAGASWTGSTLFPCRSGGSISGSIDAVAGARDVYARSKGINGDTGTIIGPIAVTVLSSYSNSGSSGSGGGSGGTGLNDGSYSESPSQSGHSESPSQSGGLY